MCWLRGESWKGDILVADVEELGKCGTRQKIHVRRLDAKEVIMPTTGEHFTFPIADGPGNMCGRDHGIRKSTSTWDKLVRSDELSGDLRGCSDKSQSVDDIMDDKEARGVFWEVGHKSPVPHQRGSGLDSNLQWRSRRVLQPETVLLTHNRAELAELPSVVFLRISVQPLVAHLRTHQTRAVTWDFGATFVRIDPLEATGMRPVRARASASVAYSHKSLSHKYCISFWLSILTSCGSNGSLDIVLRFPLHFGSSSAWTALISSFDKDGRCCGRGDAQVWL